ncbi:heterokaryon incompatibility protein-domain-containing protein [Apiosordaria backusii]|uniref:Heterokaryon incompatibility protein-domain-containing protein n=1 Tax=Apiosordaria backusii TaxID=314023 RepID=A0AA39ZPC6_9PEZI|nr:heterokaryon incompatibility protein-domain-containing protein [Apiosordaria backusii]
MVTRNLDIALRHLRHPTLVLPIWIDAICIDQQNMAERSQQVAFMCELYRKAGETYVWIGPEENYSNDVMDWIDLIGLISEVNWSTETMYNSKDYKNVGRKNADIFDVSLTWETDWFVTLRSICHLANRDYFTRLWVRQEVKMSQCKWLVCGNQRVPWQPFSNFARWMAVKPLIVQDPYANWTEQLDKRYKAGASMILSLCKGALELTVTTFDRLRFDNTNLQWKDPRDAIYANLGMLAPECRQLGIVPDYDKDPADIFTDVAVRVATKLHSLGFLESCDIDSIDLENLPTWVPDWSSPLKIDPGMENIWSSSAWISAQVEYLGDGVMVANGVAVSEVESVHYWEGDRPYEGQPYMVCDCIRYWCDLKPSDYDEHQESYLEGSNLTWLEAWCTLFLYGNLIDVFKAGQESEVDRPDLMSLQEAKEMFLIILRARSFHEIWCLDDPMWRRMDRFLSKIGNRMKGRVVFKTVNGHIGVAPASIWRGSMVSVLLDERERWQVFSSCFVVGLMDGEAITGPLPKNCRTVDWRFREDLSSDHKINRLQSGIFNEQEGTLETDPAKVLQDRGIPCIRYERQPHLLEVSPEALRNAGVELRRFVLV